jgi:putative transcriptional regulator
VRLGIVEYRDNILVTSEQIVTGWASAGFNALAPEDFAAVDLDELLDARSMTLTELANRVDITLVNLSVLKNDRARAIRFSTLEALCEALDCQPGELMTYE